MKSILITCIVSIIICSCGSSKFTTTHFGHKVEIETKTTNLWAELVAVQEDEIIIRLTNEVYTGNSKIKSSLAKVNFKNINSISISDLQNSGNDGVLLFQILPAALLGITAGAYSGGGGVAIAFAGVLMIPGLITNMIYNASTPDPVEWNSDIPKENIYDFRIYSRITHKLTEEQLNELLDYYKQKEIIVLK